MTATSVDHRGRTRPARRRSPDGQIVGAILVLGGVAWLLRESGIYLAPETILSGLLVAVGLGLLLTSRQRGHGLLIIVGIGLTMSLLGTSSQVRNARFVHRGFGDSRETPTSVTARGLHYEQGFGNLTVDLTDTTLAEGTTPLLAKVGAGNLTIVVPEGVGVTGIAKSGLGQVRLFGRVLRDGGGVTATLLSSPSASRLIDVDAEVGLGNVEVVRAGG